MKRYIDSTCSVFRHVHNILGLISLKWTFQAVNNPRSSKKIKKEYLLSSPAAAQTVSCYHNPRGHGIRAGVRDWERRHHDSRGGRYDKSAHWLCKSFSEPWKTSISWCQFPQLRGCGMFHCTQNDGACIRSPLQKRQSIIIVKVGWKASKFEWFWPQTTLCHPRLLFLAMGASFQARQIFRSEGKCTM